MKSMDLIRVIFQAKLEGKKSWVSYMICICFYELAWAGLRVYKHMSWSPKDDMKIHGTSYSISCDCFLEIGFGMLFICVRFLVYLSKF